MKYGKKRKIKKNNFYFVKYLIMKRYDLFVLFIFEVIMLATGFVFGIWIEKGSQQTITKETCIEFFNSL